MPVMKRTDAMHTYKVNEIFYSLQGEGRHAGTPAVFVRLSGCNMRCAFCDTQHQTGTQMTAEEIVAAIAEYPARTVIITGGEPTLQLDAELTDALHNAGYSIHLETNGTLPLQEGVTVDWLTCSPKEGGDLQIQRIDELKVVFWGQDLGAMQGIQAKERSLQPLDTGNADRNKEILQQTIDYILKNPVWKLSLQTHKILNVR